mmetsp:Transcript_6299/g.21678  ORF Transcript_6299/g.21678 Transcript_6299/m.21678 type:complete len:241 (+) Transcript_6299:55-777(+)
MATCGSAAASLPARTESGSGAMIRRSSLGTTASTSSSQRCSSPATTAPPTLTRRTSSTCPLRARATTSAEEISSAMSPTGRGWCRRCSCTRPPRSIFRRPTPSGTAMRGATTSGCGPGTRGGARPRRRSRTPSSSPTGGGRSTRPTAPRPTRATCGTSRATTSWEATTITTATSTSPSSCGPGRSWGPSRASIPARTSTSPHGRCSMASSTYPSLRASPSVPETSSSTSAAKWGGGRTRR